MYAFIEPFNDSVFNLANTLQIGKILLEFVAIRCHAFESIVVANIFLVWDQVKYYWLPSDGPSVNHAHERHDCD